MSMPSIATPTHWKILSIMLYEYTEKECVGVAIEGMDILYMGLIFGLKWVLRNVKLNEI